MELIGSVSPLFFGIEFKYEGVEYNRCYGINNIPFYYNNIFLNELLIYQRMQPKVRKRLFKINIHQQITNYPNK